MFNLIKIFLKFWMLKEKRLLADNSRFLDAVVSQQRAAATQHNYHKNLKKLCNKRLGVWFRVERNWHQGFHFLSTTAYSKHALRITLHGCTERISGALERLNSFLPRTKIFGSVLAAHQTSTSHFSVSSRMKTLQR